MRNSTEQVRNTVSSFEPSIPCRLIDLEGHSPTLWNASQLVAHNLHRARTQAKMTQAQAAEAISQYTEIEWSPAIYATAESSVAGKRIRQFSPSELLAFCFAFDVPIGWFFMPPSGNEAESLDMPKHAGGIGWDWVFRRTTPTEMNIDAYLDLQSDWARRSQVESARRPFHARMGDVIRGIGQTLSDDELQRYFLLGLLRRGLGGSRDLKRDTSWGEAKWFEDASAVLFRVSELFGVIGTRGPDPSHVMKQKDLEDTRRISEEIDRKRADAKEPICKECTHPVKLSDPADGTSWVHVNERLLPWPHAAIPVL